MLKILLATVIAAAVVVSCSKSSVDSAVNSVTAGAKKMSAPLASSDASLQADGLIRKLESSSDCDVYKARLRVAGRGSPYDPGTQLEIRRTYDEAIRSGCGKRE